MQFTNPLLDVPRDVFDELIREVEDEIDATNHGAPVTSALLASMVYRRAVQWLAEHGNE